MKGRYSIIQENMNYCFFCGRYGTEIHHVFFGNPNRKWSEKYHCIVGLCPQHHRGKHGVHQDRELDLTLKQIAQTKFNKTYPEADFLAVFGRNYL